MPPRIAPAVVRAGLPEQLRFHDFRHRAAALLISEGATMEQVKQILGHSTIRVTSDTYGHLFDDHADPAHGGAGRTPRDGRCAQSVPKSRG